MKICFVWIEKFRNLENFGFNLASDIKFNYENETNKIKITDRTEILEDFFGDGIVDATGIIGRNGSGKSNTLELLCKILKESKTAIDSDFIIITKEENTYTCHYSFKEREAPILPNSDNFLAEKYSGSIKNLRVVFFSNIKDGRRNNFSSNVIDISANSTQRNEHFTSEFLAQFKFIKSDFFKPLNITPPDKIVITHQLWTKPTPIRLDETSKKVLKQLKTIMRGRIKELTPQNKLAQIIKLGIFIDTYTSMIFHPDGMRDEESLPDRLLTYINNLKGKTTKTEEITKHLIREIKITLGMTLDEEEQQENQDTVKKQSNHINAESQLRVMRNGHYLIEAIENVKKITTLIPPEYEYKSEGSRQQELETFTLDYKVAGFSEFADSAFNYLSTSPRFDIDWIGISSGHKAYLNLFTSTHDAIKGIRNGTIFLCIDEGDLYLHPMWQVEFFNRLRTTLPKMTTMPIQLILTSHSPFLVSDLPIQSLVMLNDSKDKNITRKFQENKSTIESSEKQVPGNNTFGGNIYEIYRMSFFLDDKRTSDFAYEKISEWIKTINKNNLNDKEKEKLSKLINLIGDRLIKFRLLSDLNIKPQEAQHDSALK